jgi:hypothetical protein
MVHRQMAKSCAVIAIRKKATINSQDLNLWTIEISMKIGEHVKVKFSLQDDENGYPGFAVESLWAKVCEDGVFEIDSIPFFAKLVSLGDKVFADEDGQGNLVYKAHASYSKHSTVRIVIFDMEQVSHTRKMMSEMGCPTELSHNPKLIAVDIPPDVEIDRINALLKEGEKAGRWEYEEGAIW